MLKRELGLTERDIVDIPQLFKLHQDSRGTLKAEAFFPNMVRKWPSDVAHLALPVARLQRGQRGSGCRSRKLGCLLVCMAPSGLQSPCNSQAAWESDNIATPTWQMRHSKGRSLAQEHTAGKRWGSEPGSRARGPLQTPRPNHRAALPRMGLPVR